MQTKRNRKACQTVDGLKEYDELRDGKEGRVDIPDEVGDEIETDEHTNHATDQCR